MKLQNNFGKINQIKLFGGRKMLAVIKMFIAFFMAFNQLMTPITAVAAGGEDKYFYAWSINDEYSSDTYAVSLEKDPDKDFVVLNLADVQLKDYEAYADEWTIASETIDRLIKEIQPDLITLTGDNAWGGVAYLELINFLESYEIPWAPIMGNHDGEKTLSEFWAAYRMSKAEHCLFKFGPEDMGYGNYILNITENGRVIHTLFMMDTHSDAENGGYDHLWTNQINWYKWAVKGIAEENGGTVESTVFIHIPVCEYKDAWKSVYDEENECFYEDTDIDYFGHNGEGVCSPKDENNTGFFDVCKSLGSTKNIIAGHDHTNCASIMYEGIRLSYALKAGPGCYWDEEKNGGSTLTISSDGSAVFEHHYVDPATIQLADTIC